MQRASQSGVNLAQEVFGAPSMPDVGPDCSAQIVAYQIEAREVARRESKSSLVTGFVTGLAVGLIVASLYEGRRHRGQCRQDFFLE